MPGLAGVISSGRPLDNANKILHAISNVQRVRGVKYDEKSYCGQQTVILNTLTGLLGSTRNQPARSSSGNAHLFLEGEIFNRKDLLSLADMNPDLSLCELLLALFERLGDDFIDSVSGEFNIVILQEREQKVTIYSDHLASMPMYYMESGDRLLFGSEKKSILALLDTSPALDQVGLLQIFAHRHNLDERTFLRGVKRMMPGTRVVYDRGRLKIDRYQLLRFRVPLFIPPIDDLADQWAEHLKAATVKRISGKERLLISLSAGLDSRAVACAIPREFRPVVSRTRGTVDALETVLASKIASRLDFDHFREDPSVSSYSNIIPKIAWRTECEVHFANGISLSNHRAIKERGDFIVGGWLGDASSGGHISPALLRPGNRTHCNERSYWRYLVYSADALADIFTSDFLALNFPKLRESFITSFESLEASTNIQLFELWDLHQRQRRMTTSSMAVDSYAFEKVRPFYDKDYLNFTLTLPSRYRFGQTLYQAMIYRLGASVRDIPSANTGLRLRKSLSGNAMNKGLVISRRVVTKVGEKMRWRKVHHGLNEDLGLAIRSDNGFRPLIEDFLFSANFDGAIFNKAGIIKMLDQHFRSNLDRSYELGYVATFAAGLPYFLNKTMNCPSEAEPLL